MSDTYQAVYDAVRSRFSGCDVGSAVESAIQRAGIGDYARQAFSSIDQAGVEMQAPSVLYRPKLSIDGDQWCALYGDNLQEGVCGFGTSPNRAMQDFDRNWLKDLKPRKESTLQTGGSQV